jgi:2-hydroxychromene-2-carboxylate isomerase
MDMRLIYYFWIISDWAYFGGPRVESIAKRHGIDVDFRPVRLLEVYRRTGGIPLGQRAPQRQAERVWELRRWRARLGMTCNIEPRYFPVDDEPASRLLIAAKLRGLDLHGLAQAIMRALWAEDANIADPATLAAIAARFVSDPRALLDEAATSRVLAEYDRYTDQAPADGVFGSPFYIFDGEPYWGQDRLDFLEEAIIRAKAGTVPSGRG